MNFANFLLLVECARVGRKPIKKPALIKRPAFPGSSFGPR